MKLGECILMDKEKGWLNFGSDLERILYIVNTVSFSVGHKCRHSVIAGYFQSGFYLFLTINKLTHIQRFSSNVLIKM